MAIAEGSQGTESGTGGKHLVESLEEGEWREGFWVQIGCHGRNLVGNVGPIIIHSSSADDGDGDGRRFGRSVACEAEKKRNKKRKQKKNTLMQISNSVQSV